MIGRERLETLFDDSETIGVVRQLLAEAWAEGWQDACDETLTQHAPDGPTDDRNPYR